MAVALRHSPAYIGFAMDKENIGTARGPRKIYCSLFLFLFLFSFLCSFPLLRSFSLSFSFLPFSSFFPWNNPRKQHRRKEYHDH